MFIYISKVIQSDFLFLDFSTIALETWMLILNTF